MNIQRDEDGLLSDSRSLLELHKYVRLPKYLWRDIVKNKNFVNFGMEIVWEPCRLKNWQEK